MENEPVLSYKKGSSERKELEKVLDKMASECEEVPLVIGNEEIKSDLCKYQVMVRLVSLFNLYIIIISCDFIYHI